MITVNIEKGKLSNTFICKMSYNGVELMFPMDSERGVELNNRHVSQIFNLCSYALTDYKNAILKEHEANKDRIKFVGVDYEKL